MCESSFAPVSSIKSRSWSETSWETLLPTYKLTCFSKISCARHTWACILMCICRERMLVLMHAAQVYASGTFMAMEDVFLALSFIPALQQRWCIKNVQWGSLFVQTITPSSKPHRAPVVLGMKDEPTPLWDLQRFRQNWNNCTKQQWIWTTDGRVCKCLRNEPVCSICLHFKGIVCPKVIILSFTHLHFDPVWILLIMISMRFLAGSQHVTLMYGFF